MAEELIKKLNALEKDNRLNEIENFYDEKNIFRILSIEGNEIRHSNFLAWLLNPKGQHGLGDKFLKAFLVKLGFSDDIDTSEVVVEREKLHIDLLVYSSKGKWFFIIENKTWTKDHGNQLNRYLEDVKSYLVGYESKFHAYLTPFGEDPTEDYDKEKWKNVDYAFIKETIKELNKSNKEGKAKTYINDYVQILEDSLLMEKENDFRELCMKVYTDHKEAIDAINSLIGSEAAMRSMQFKKDLQSKEKELNIKVGVCTNVFTRFITNDLAALVGEMGSNRWGEDNKDLILYEITSDKNTNALSLQVVVGPAGEGYEKEREAILSRFKENKGNKFYNGKGLKKSKFVEGWAWINTTPILNNDDFSKFTNEELSNRLLEYISGEAFRELNKQIVNDVRIALGKK